MTQIWRLLGISPFSTLHRTCCVRSPPIPKFKAYRDSKYLDHTVLYRDKPFTIESPMSKILAPLVCAICEKFSCCVCHPGLKPLPTGVDVESEDLHLDIISSSLFTKLCEKLVTLRLSVKMYYHSSKIRIVHACFQLV